METAVTLCRQSNPVFIPHACFSITKLVLIFPARRAQVRISFQLNDFYLLYLSSFFMTTTWFSFWLMIQKKINILRTESCLSAKFQKCKSKSQKNQQNFYLFSLQNVHMDNTLKQTSIYFRASLCMFLSLKKSVKCDILIIFMWGSLTHPTIYYFRLIAHKCIKSLVRQFFDEISRTKIYINWLFHSRRLPPSLSLHSIP